MEQETLANIILVIGVCMVIVALWGMLSYTSLGG